MTPLPNFTTALGSRCGDSALMAQWQDLLNGEMTMIRPWLQANGTAAVIQRADTAGRLVTFRVYEHSKQDIVGVDDEDGERVDLRLEDVLLWSVRWDLVTISIHAGLQLSGAPRSMPGIQRAWELGRFTLTASQSVPVFLCAASSFNLAAACTAILAQAHEPGVILVPDLRQLAPEVVAAARAKALLMVGLGDRFELDAQRRWVGRHGPESIFGDLRALMGLNQVEAMPYRWERNGALWKLAFEGIEVPVEHEIGFLYLSYLLEIPPGAEPMTAADIVAKAYDAERIWQAGFLGTTTEKADNHDLYARVRDLQAQMDKAEEREDRITFDRCERLRDELLDHLKKGQGMANEGRPVGDGEDARKTVYMGINRALKVLENMHPTLWKHLKASLKTLSGYKPRYVPDEPVPWVVSRGM